MGAEDMQVLADALEAAARVLRAGARKPQARTVLENIPAAAEDNEQKRAVLTVREAAEELRVSRSTIYGLLSSDDLPSIRVGSRRLIVRRNLVEWLGRQHD